MKKLSVLVLAIVVASLLLTAQAHAAPVDSAGIMDNILQRFSENASHWRNAIISYATWLFWSLALLSMVWTFGMLALKNGGISEALAEIVRFLAVTGFFWWILLHGPEMATSIIDSMRKIASSASNMNDSVSPSGIADIGFDIVSKVIDQSSLWSPVNSAVGIVMGVVILCVLALIAVNMLLLLVSGWMLAYGGVFLLGFGGGRWTTDIAINYYKTVLGLGLQLFCMILIVGIGQSFIDQYYQTVQAGNVSLKGLCVMLVASIVLLALVNKVPPMFASIVGGGGSTSGIGSFGAGALVGAAGTAAAAAGIAANAAASVGSAALSAGANTAGGMSALKAAFTQAQQHMSNGSDMFSGPGVSSSAGGSGGLGGGSSSGGSGGFMSAMNTAGRFAADMGANLAKGAGAVAKDKAANRMDATSQRVGQSTGGKIASAISGGSGAGTDVASNFAGDSLGVVRQTATAGADTDDEVAAFVKKRSPAQDDA
ncbi:P-type conjugative transfer protein TrbL [Paraburkholderia tropica]|uniref:P-type conjugative transfer protein TrbL n=1 Tax=Paraburkholderia tropica TaxID=92647 RepID=UPI002ABDAD47|nr:P-type conjugative transfer protein TrbL [Paraburkholderia tropica]